MEPELRAPVQAGLAGIQMSFFDSGQVLFVPYEDLTQSGLHQRMLTTEDFSLDPITDEFRMHYQPVALSGMPVNPSQLVLGNLRKKKIDQQSVTTFFPWENVPIEEASCYLERDRELLKIRISCSFQTGPLVCTPSLTFVGDSEPSPQMNELMSQTF